MDINIPLIEKINLTIGDSVYKMESPSALENSTYTDSLKKLESSVDVVNLTLDYLAKYGLPRDVGIKFNFTTLAKIITTISGDEKKS